MFQVPNSTHIIPYIDFAWIGSSPSMCEKKQFFGAWKIVLLQSPISSHKTIRGHATKKMNRKGELQTSRVSNNLRIWRSYSRAPQILKVLCVWYSWKYVARLGFEPLKFLYSEFLYNTQAVLQQGPGDLIFAGGSHGFCWWLKMIMDFCSWEVHWGSHGGIGWIYWRWFSSIQYQYEHIWALWKIKTSILTSGPDGHHTIDYIDFCHSPCTACADLCAFLNGLGHLKNDLPDSRITPDLPWDLIEDWLCRRQITSTASRPEEAPHFPGWTGPWSAPRHACPASLDIPRGQGRSTLQQIEGRSSH